MRFCVSLEGDVFCVFFLILSLFYFGLIDSASRHLLRVFSHKFASVVLLLPRNYDNSISCEFIYPKYVLDYRFQFAVSS